MILFSDLIGLLVAGDGSQQSNFVDVDGGQFNRSKTNKIINLLNAALGDVFKRFVVNYEEVVIQTTRDVIDYPITLNNVRSDLNPSGFILSNFNKPLFSISAVSTMDGKQLPLNNNSKEYFKDRYLVDTGTHYLLPECNPYTYILKNYYTLRVPKNLEASQIVLSVRSGHPIIPLVPDANLDTFDLTSIEIDLPYPYLNALAYYILHRITNSRAAETIGHGIFHEGNNYQQKYVDECNSLKVSNLEVEQVSDMNMNLHRQGFI